MADVLAEHIEYLTLKGRHSLFARAIGLSLKSGDTVADLGCGLGVLGMQCLAAGASKVYGIDSSDAIHLARASIERAGLADRYECIAGTTFEATLPQAVDLLICDHVGYFGFDYGIVDMLRDAASRMLKPGGRIIPDRLALEIAGVSSDACHAKAAAWKSPAIPEELRWIDAQARNSEYPHSFVAGELCSTAVRLGEIALGEDAAEFFVFAAELTAERACRFDGIAGWFDAHLGGDVWMTNSPLTDRSIGRPQAFLPVSEPFEVEAGETIGVSLRAMSDGRMIAWTVQPPGEAPKQRMSTWASTALSQSDLAERGDQKARLSQSGEAARYVLSLVDGLRSFAQIEALILDERPDLMPTPQATREFVRRVLARNTKI